MSGELKKCPFCGSRAEIYTEREESLGYWPESIGARCTKCEAKSGKAFEASRYDWEKSKTIFCRGEAIESAASWWNRRAADQE